MANYFVIGADHKEYGPVSSEELRKWIGEDRADAQTKVRADGATEWLPLSSVPEFGDALKKTASPPPTISALPATVKTSTLAITSLVLGILALPTCGATTLFGLIFGIIALVKVSNSRGALRGQGLALAGTIVSGVLLVLLPVMVAMLLPALASAHDRARQIHCMNNEKQLALAVRIYSGDHANQLPSAATWCDAIKTAVGSEKVFQCPAVNGTSRCDYAFNAKLDGMDANKVDPQTVMIFESDAGWNAHGGPELQAPRHRARHIVVAFADGHVEVMSDTRLHSLRWDP
jgi:prepilin-type processing-associated H-X9-DG protein